MDGKTLKEARESKKLTQKQVGEACGYKDDAAQIYVQGWETNKRPVPRKHLATIAQLLDISIEKLL